MIYINEFLPNPAGSDADGEWIEFWNDGGAVVNLDGWKIETASGKFFLLSGKSIVPGGFLVLRRQETKLTLNNQDGKLKLYNPAGTLVNQAEFLGSAPEGKSFARTNYDYDYDNNDDGGVFVFAEPTPGAANKITSDLLLTTNDYQAGVRLNPSLEFWDVSAMAVGAAFTLAALVMIVLKHNGGLSKLLFTRKNCGSE